MTKDQKKSLEDVRCDIYKHCLKSTSEEVRVSIRTGLIMFQHAIQRDGYVAETSQVVGQLLSGACVRKMLLPYIQPLKSYNATCNKSKAVMALIKKVGLESEAITMLGVMCALLAETKAWTVFDKEPAIFDADAINKVAPALGELGFGEEEVMERGKDKVCRQEMMGRWPNLLRI